MSLDISSFSNLVNRIDGDRTVVVNSNATKVKSHGSFSTFFFTTKSKLRASTNEFLNAYTKAFGTHLGEMARETLSEVLEAGKPLKACVVKELIELGEAKKAHFAIASSDVTAANSAIVADLADEVAAKMCPNATADQIAGAKLIIGKALPAICKQVFSASSASGMEIERLKDAVKDLSTPYLKAGLEMVFNIPSDGKLEAIGAPQDKTLVKAQAYALLQKDGEFIFNSLPEEQKKLATNWVMSAACQLEPNNDGTTTVTRGTIFAKLLPHDAIPKDLHLGLFSRGYIPDAAHVDAMTADEFADLMKDVTEKMTDTGLNAGRMNVVSADNSPFKTGSNNFLLSWATKGFMPMDLINKNGVTNLTLNDVPLLQANIQIGQGVETPANAEEQFDRDITTLGRYGCNVNSGVSPKFQFSDANGTSILNVNLGAKDFKVDPATAEETASQIKDTVDSVATTPEQKKMLLCALSKQGRTPLTQMIFSQAQYSGINESSPFDYQVTKNADNSISVTITTGEAITGTNGNGSITYLIQPNGCSSISDFAWNPPNPREALKDFCTNTVRRSETVAQIVSHMGIDKPFLVEFVEKFVGEGIMLQYANVPDNEIPPLSVITQKLLDNPPMKYYKVITGDFGFAQRFAGMNPEDRELYINASESLGFSNNPVTVSTLIGVLPNLKAFMAEHPNMSVREGIWQVLFNEPLPEHLHGELKGLTGDSAVLDKLLDQMRDKVVAQHNELHPDNPIEATPSLRDQVMINVAALLDVGVSVDMAIELYVKGDLGRPITLQELEPQPVYAYPSHSLRGDVDAIARSISRDLSRRGSAGIWGGARDSSKLNINFNERQPVTYTLVKPEGLNDEELANYRASKDNPVAKELVEQLRAATGNNSKQMESAIICAGQGGATFLKLLVNTALKKYGFDASEHSGAVCTFSKDDKGNINLRYENCPDSQLEFHWTYTIDVEGKQSLTDFFISDEARVPAPEGNNPQAQPAS